MSARSEDVWAGVRVEWLSVTWMGIEAAVALVTGVLARSLVLSAFGADSVIELVSGGVLLWRLYAEVSGGNLVRVRLAERKASYVVGIALLALALAILGSAVYDLWARMVARPSGIGLLLALAASVFMPYLSRAKKSIGRGLGSRALVADGSCSMVCAYMSWILLGGVVLTAIFPWWWVNPLAELGLLYYVVREGVEAIQSARGVEDACHCEDG